jgi:hypothetical protein
MKYPPWLPALVRVRSNETRPPRYGHQEQTGRSPVSLGRSSSGPGPTEVLPTSIRTVCDAADGPRLESIPCRSTVGIPDDHETDQRVST